MAARMELRVKDSLVWAQALRWTGNAQKYAVARAVFQHLPLPETLKADAELDGLIPAAAIVRRWERPGARRCFNRAPGRTGRVHLWRS